MPTNQTVKNLLVCIIFSLTGAILGLLIALVLAVIASHTVPSLFSGYTILMFSSALVLLGAFVGTAKGIARWKQQVTAMKSY